MFQPTESKSETAFSYFSKWLLNHAAQRQTFSPTSSFVIQVIQV